MFRIEVTRRARDDADAAFAWLAANVSPTYAERWYQEVFEQIETLIQHPSRCPVAPESSRLNTELRELIYGKRSNKYRIIFTLDEDLITVLSIGHAARDVFDL